MHLFSAASLVTQSTKGSVDQYSAVHCVQSQPQNSVTSAGCGNPSVARYPNPQMASAGQRLLANAVSLQFGWLIESWCYLWRIYFLMVYN